MPARSKIRQRECTLSNVTRRKSERAALEIADTPLSRMRGLMFRKKIVPILFKFGQNGLYPIHSCFVRGCFDAIYLSEKKIVVEVFRKIPPGTAIVSPSKKAAYLLELPPGLSKRLCISEKDQMRWQYRR